MFISVLAENAIFHIYIRGPSPRQPFHKGFEKKLQTCFPLCHFSEHVYSVNNFHFDISFALSVCHNWYINVHLKRRSIKKVERKGKGQKKKSMNLRKGVNFSTNGDCTMEFSYAIWYKYNENKHFEAGPIIVKAHKQRRIAGWPRLLQGWSWLLIDWKAGTERNTQRWEDGQHFYVLSIGCQSRVNRYCTYRCVRFTHIHDISCWHGNCFHLIIQHT